MSKYKRNDNLAKRASFKGSSVNRTHRRARRKEKIRIETAKRFGMAPVTILLPEQTIDKIVSYREGGLIKKPVECIIFEALAKYLESVQAPECSRYPSKKDLSTSEVAANLLCIDKIAKAALAVSGE
ncbi:MULTISPECIES: hypothetical protein [Cobetia]|uniref:hypothetical protein n=1 Tax=Cobetia TaxID=204286 RepID=UPI0015842A8F|nr:MULTISPECIES: hypothetical protein [Cobetia]MDI4659576.1 hypothetical protein [Cobetia sp. BMC6]NUJ56125.1 hypothetical protein [Cobetia marina]